jgi:hypothetical protein
MPHPEVAVQDRDRIETDPDRLSKSSADRLLRRASELDAARQANSSIAELRAAATEAGISAQAFDAALAELQRSQVAHVPAPPPRFGLRPRRWVVAGSISVVMILGGIAVTLAGATSDMEMGPTSLREELIELRCLTPLGAADLLRTVLNEKWDRVIASGNPDSRTVKVLTTPQQLEKAKALLEKHDGPGSTACAIRQGTPPPAPAGGSKQNEGPR